MLRHRVPQHHRVWHHGAAGVILDAGSSGNRLLYNDITYGGDGIFVRSVIGTCATDNVFIGNDTSFSPHNAIESWCDRNQYKDNIASDSHYGLWLGGSDEAVVEGNRIERNKVDGISIQIGEARHVRIAGNHIPRSGSTSRSRSRAAMAGRTRSCPGRRGSPRWTTSSSGSTPGTPRRTTSGWTG